MQSSNQPDHVKIARELLADAETKRLEAFNTAGPSAATVLAQAQQLTAEAAVHAALAQAVAADFANTISGVQHGMLPSTALGLPADRFN